MAYIYSYNIYRQLFLQYIATTTHNKWNF
jgi:hypothetical protein